MSFIKALLFHYTPHLLKPSINPPKLLKYNSTLNYLSNLFSTQIPNSADNSIESQKPRSKSNLVNKRPLDIVYKEALGLCEKEETFENLGEENDQNGELKKRLYELELEIRQLKSTLVASVHGGNFQVFERSKRGKEKDEGVSSSKSKTLGALSDRKIEEGESSIGEVNEVVLKEISQDMVVLLRHLYDKGYFRDVNFLPGNSFDMNCFYEKYARDYVKFALGRLGKDHQDIAKWLSGGDLMTVALFGCPSFNKIDVFAAKKLRRFFKIDEDAVCGKCVLKSSCKYVNQSVWRKDDTILRLDLVLRLLWAYSLEEAPSQVKLTDNLKSSVSRLIHEVINLTREVDEIAPGSRGDQT